MLFGQGSDYLPCIFVLIAYLYAAIEDSNLSQALASMDGSGGGLESGVDPHGREVCRCVTKGRYHNGLKKHHLVLNQVPSNFCLMTSAPKETIV